MVSWLGLARSRLRARQQFGKGERFDQVIVCAQLQAMYPVLDGIARGQEQHRRIPTGLAHGLQDLPTVATG